MINMGGTHCVLSDMTICRSPLSCGSYSIITDSAGFKAVRALFFSLEICLDFDARKHLTGNSGKYEKLFEAFSEKLGRRVLPAIFCPCFSKI